MTIFKTFKDFIKPDSIDNIREKCGPFLEESGGIPLYRGYGFKLSAMMNGAREVEVRTDRKPRDTDVNVHTLMDAYFKERFGKSVRSAGLFTTGNVKTAKSYGSAYYVLPVGDFSYIWGELHGEPVRDTLRISRLLKSELEVSKSADAQKVTRKVMDSVNWHADKLEQALKTGAEIAVLAKTVILIPVSKTPYSEIINR